MKPHRIALAAFISAASIGLPQFAAAQDYPQAYQQYGDYGADHPYRHAYYDQDHHRRYYYDRCRAYRHEQANQGTAVGAVSGGILGGVLSGGRLGGALLGAGAGAVAGHAIAQNNARC